MAGGHRKFRSAHPFGKKKTSASGLQGFIRSPSSEGDTDDAIAHLIPTATEVSKVMRVDTPVLSDIQKAEIECCTRDTEQKFSQMSATRRKQSLLCEKTEDAEATATRTLFTVLSLSALNELLQCVKCKLCGSSVNISKGDREYAIAVKLILNCDACGEVETTWSSPRVDRDARCDPFEVNMLATRAVLSTGNKQTVLNDFSAALNISKRGMHTKTYQKYVKNKLNPAARRAVAHVIGECVEAVKALYSDSNFGNPCNIVVSFSQVMCSILLCSQSFAWVVNSAQKKVTLGMNSGEQDTGAKCTFHVSLARWKSKLPTVLFGRLLNKHRLRYTTMLSDGNSRAFNYPQKDKVYGFVPTEKEDCKNHVSKRMGTALRNLVQKKKEEGRPGLGGKGKLTGEFITKPAMYYGWALKGHQGNIDGMQKAALPTCHHATSTDAQPNHSLCPKGQDSWCKQNKAAAKEQPAPKHR